MTALGPPGLRLVSNSQGVPATMYGAAKGIVALMSAESCVRPSAVEKNLLGMRRVPSSFSGPTACVGVRGAGCGVVSSTEYRGKAGRRHVRLARR